MAVQTTVAIGTVTTGTILPGAGTRCEVPTACDDLYTVQAPLSEEEIRRLGVPGPVYMVESVSLAKIKLLDAVKYLAESGQLHTEMVGMNLQSCAGALVQVKLWIDAGKAAGQPYPWETVGAALVPVLARALEREPTKEEVEEILKRMKLDIGAIMKKVPTAGEGTAKITGVIDGGAIEPSGAIYIKWGKATLIIYVSPETEISGFGDVDGDGIPNTLSDVIYPFGEKPTAEVEFSEDANGRKVAKSITKK